MGGVQTPKPLPAATLLNGTKVTKITASDKNVSKEAVLGASLAIPLRAMGMASKQQVMPEIKLVTKNLKLRHDTANKFA